MNTSTLKQAHFFGFPVIGKTEEEIAGALAEMQAASGITIQTYFVNVYGEPAEVSMVGMLFETSEQRDAFRLDKAALEVFEKFVGAPKCPGCPVCQPEVPSGDVSDLAEGVMKADANSVVVGAPSTVQ